MADERFKTGSQNYSGFSPQEQKELDKAIADVNMGKNLEGPFDSMEEFISSMKK